VLIFRGLLGDRLEPATVQKQYLTPKALKDALRQLIMQLPPSMLGNCT
jgi:hypothetical protein